MANNQYISPFVSDGDTFRSADKTSYDITSKEPLGVLLMTQNQALSIIILQVTNI